MVFPNNNGTNNITTGWAIGGAILLLLLGLSFFYNGRGTSSKSGENPPNAVTQSQPQK
jgi:hypothetical protein